MAAGISQPDKKSNFDSLMGLIKNLVCSQIGVRNIGHKIWSHFLWLLNMWGKLWIRKVQFRAGWQTYNESGFDTVAWSEVRRW